MIAGARRYLPLGLTLCVGALLSPRLFLVRRQILILAIAYYTAGKLGLLLAIPPGYATAIWPSSGIALAVLLVLGTRLWPGILLGSFLVNIGTSFDPSSAASIARSIGVAVAIGAGASLQAVAGTWLIGRYVSAPLELIREQDVAVFTILGAPISCLVNATLSVSALALAGTIAWAHYPFTWWTWWVGDTIGVLVVTPVLLAWFAEPRGIWARRRLALTLPLGLMFALVVFFFVRASALEQARITLEFRSQATHLMAAVTGRLDSAMEMIHSVGGLSSTMGEVDDEAFQSFVGPILVRHPEIQALSWNPRVTAAERESFERLARTRVSPDFQITERQPSGELGPAGRRDEHVVVLHIEPRPGNEAARGYDVASDAVRREALLRARRTGQPAATGRIQLVQERGNQAGVLIFLPVHERQAVGSRAEDHRPVRGFVTGVFHIGTLMHAALAEANRDRVEITLLDEGQRLDAGRLLWASSADAGTRAPQDHELRVIRRLAMAGRPWSIVVRASPDHAAFGRSWRAWTVLAGGLLFTGLLGAFLLVVTGRATIVERLGALRAEELATANAILEKEIAERKQAEQTLLDTETELRQAQKMEAIGQLAGGVAHDFNNLLTVIIGRSNLLLQRLPDDPAVTRRAINLIKTTADRAAQVTQQLLAFSRKQVLQPKVLDLNEVMSGMVKLLHRLIGEDVQLAFVPGSGLGMVQADPSQLEQVVINLAVNARDAMPRGGRLTVETANVTLNAHRTDRDPDLPAGSYIMLSVSDTGTGMDAATRSRIFEPFFTTKGPGKGTGLGLATVYGIVKQSGGAIDVTSEVGVGTTFTIYLPRVDTNLTPPPPPIETQAALPRGTETILLVEDDDSLRDLAREVLADAGYTLLVASSPTEAQRVAREYAGAIDLLLTDVVMPGMSGRQLADQALAARPTMKLLYVSGHTDDAIVHHGVLEPGVQLLPKPFTPASLVSRVREVLDQKLPIR